MSRRCSSCIVKKSFQVLRGAMGNSSFFRCGKDGGNVVTPRHDGLGTRRHGIFWRRFQSLPHVCVVVSPSPEKLQQNPMKDERVCRLFQDSMFLVVSSWASLLIFSDTTMDTHHSHKPTRIHWQLLLKIHFIHLPRHGKTRIYQPTTFQRQWVSIFMGFSSLERKNSSQSCSKQDFFFICPHAVCLFVDRETPEWPERSERPNDQALGQENLYVEAWGHVEVLVGPYQL